MSLKNKIKYLRIFGLTTENPKLKHFVKKLKLVIIIKN